MNHGNVKQQSEQDDRGGYYKVYIAEEVPVCRVFDRAIQKADVVCQRYDHGNRLFSYCGRGTDIGS